MERPGIREFIYMISANGEPELKGKTMKLTTLFFAAAFGAGLAFVSPSADATPHQGGDAVKLSQVSSVQ